MEKARKTFIIIFGANGDLTSRKLLPAIYKLYQKNTIDNNYRIICTGRRGYTTDKYIKHINKNLLEFTKDDNSENRINEFLDLIEYKYLEFSDINTFRNIKEYIINSRGCKICDADLIYYLATAPEFFALITKNLKEVGLTDDKEGIRRAVFEKPFGRNLETAKALNAAINEIFNEENIYRIDHYLGKEMLQNILYIRFANSIFEPLWRHTHIESIEILSNETLGVGTRGGYYEESGALKDMIQNHLMQMMTLVTMEPPKAITANAIRDEKVKILKNIDLYDDDYAHNVVRGQYIEGTVNGNKIKGYRNEDKVSNESMVETYISIKLKINNERWENTPIYLTHGKRMGEQKSEIIIRFKECCNKDYFGIVPPSNVLIIKVQPISGIYFSINAKKTGIENQIEQVNMDYCHSCKNNGNIPEAYERLLSDAIRGENMLFTRWDELEAAWIFTDIISKIFEQNKVDMVYYKAGVGPKSE